MFTTKDPVRKRKVWLVENERGEVDVCVEMMPGDVLPKDKFSEQGAWYIATISEKGITLIGDIPQDCGLPLDRHGQFKLIRSEP